MTYRIYRLNDTEENTNYRFLGSKQLQLHAFWPPKLESYEKIWEGNCPKPKDYNVLDLIYAAFNIAPPEGFNRYSMSVGDIVVLTDEEPGAYFCDSVGWTELPDFFKTVSTVAE